MKTSNAPRLALALILTLCCLVTACRSPSDRPDANHEAALGARLLSVDHSVRYEAVRAVAGLGWDGRDLMKIALGDRADVVSRAAQEWFVSHGEQAVWFLADALVSIPQDTGLYASLVGGEEQPRGKSLAGTLWQTLVRGVAPERALSVMEELAGHDSPRVRAVVLFSAGSIRDSRFLGVLESLSHDNAPLVKKQYREALIRLISPEWYSTPELDEGMLGEVLSLLEPELTAILESQEQAASFRSIGRGRTLGDALAHAPLPHHRERLVGMLEARVPRLSPAGAARAGLIIERQAWHVPQRESYINVLWASSRVRDEVMLGESYRRMMEGLTRAGDQEDASRYWAVLAHLPHFLYDEVFETMFLDLENIDNAVAPELASRFLERASAEVREDLKRKALHVLRDYFAGVDSALTSEAIHTVHSLMGLERLQPFGNEVGLFLRGEVTARLGRFASEAHGLSVSARCRVVDLLARDEDQRYWEVFQRVWDDHRYDEDIRLCLAFLRSHGDPRTTEYLAELVLEGSDRPHTDAKVTAATWLVSWFDEPRVGDPAKEELFGQLLDVAQDPEEHPRTRAAIATMLEAQGLNEEQRVRAVEVFLPLTQPPHDWNLRSKTCLSLGRAGIHASYLTCGSLLFAAGSPRWVLPNVLEGLLGLEGRRSGAVSEPGAGDCLLVVALEAALALFPDPPVETLPIQVNNYFQWGVMYETYPPLEIRQLLRARTEVDLGYDVPAWRGLLGCGPR